MDIIISYHIHVYKSTDAIDRVRVVAAHQSRLRNGVAEIISIYIQRLSLSDKLPPSSFLFFPLINGRFLPFFPSFNLSLSSQAHLPLKRHSFKQNLATLDGFPTIKLTFNTFLLLFDLEIGCAHRNNIFLLNCCSCGI